MQIGQKASASGAKWLRAHYVKGPRNQPIEAFLLKHGFNGNNGGTHEVEVERAPSAPTHLHLIVE